MKEYVCAYCKEKYSDFPVISRLVRKEICRECEFLEALTLAGFSNDQTLFIAAFAKETLHPYELDHVQDDN